MEVIELSLYGTEITHLVEAHGYCPEGEGLEGLRFQSVHKAAGTYTDGQMRVVVHAGAGSEEGVHVVHCRLADRPAVGAGRKGLACPLLRSKRVDGVDDPLLQSTQILGRFDDDF